MYNILGECENDNFFLDCLYDSNKLLENINKLKERKKNIILGKFGIEGEPLNSNELAKEQGITRSRILSIIIEALRNLRYKNNEIRYKIPDISYEELREDEIQEIIKSLGNLIFVPDKEFEHDELNINAEDFRNIINICNGIKENIVMFDELTKDIEYDCNFRKEYRVFLKESPKTKEELEELLSRIDNLSGDEKNSITVRIKEKIISKFISNNKIPLPKEFLVRMLPAGDIREKELQKQIDEINKIPIKDIGLSRSSLEYFKDEGIYTVGSLLSKERIELRTNLMKKCGWIIQEILKEHKKYEDYIEERKEILQLYTQQDEISQNAILKHATKREIQSQISEINSVLISELNLSVRSYNCLMRSGMYTVMDLLAKEKEDLIKIRNLGGKSLKEIMLVHEKYRQQLEQKEMELRCVERLSLINAVTPEEEYGEICKEGRMVQSSTPEEEYTRINQEKELEKLIIEDEELDEILLKTEELEQMKENVNMI